MVTGRPAGRTERMLALLAFALPCSCGGRALAVETCDGDASAHDGGSHLVVDGATSIAADALPDAIPSVPPPAPGEYPDPSGGLCGQSDTCAPGAGLCDFQSGWCCHGRFTTDRDGQAECLCGQSLGCPPPQLCCSAHGATVSVCVADAKACNGVAY
jgi:hypothetical protein